MMGSGFYFKRAEGGPIDRVGTIFLLHELSARYALVRYGASLPPTDSAALRRDLRGLGFRLRWHETRRGDGGESMGHQAH